jgi:hypothetical protein
LGRQGKPSITPKKKDNIQTLLWTLTQPGRLQYRETIKGDALSTVFEMSKLSK